MDKEEREQVVSGLLEAEVSGLTKKEWEPTEADWTRFNDRRDELDGWEKQAAFWGTVKKEGPNETVHPKDSHLAASIIDLWNDNYEADTEPDLFSAPIEFAHLTIKGTCVNATGIAVLFEIHNGYEDNWTDDYNSKPGIFLYEQNAAMAEQIRQIAL